MKYSVLVFAVLLLILSGVAYSSFDVFGATWGTISMMGGVFYLYIYNTWDEEF